MAQNEGGLRAYNLSPWMEDGPDDWVQAILYLPGNNGIDDKNGWDFDGQPAIIKTGPLPRNGGGISISLPPEREMVTR